MAQPARALAFGKVQVPASEHARYSFTPHPCLLVPGVSSGLSSGALPPGRSGCWLARSSLAALLGSWRGKRSAGVPSTKPHCSEQIRLELGCIFVK